MYTPDPEYKVYIIALVICLTVILLLLYHNPAKTIIPLILTLVVLIYYILSLASFNGYKDLSVNYLVFAIVFILVIALVMYQSKVIAISLGLIIAAIIILCMAFGINTTDDVFFISLVAEISAFYILSISGFANIGSIAIGLATLLAIAFYSSKVGWYKAMLISIPVTIGSYVVLSNLSSMSDQ